MDFQRTIVSKIEHGHHTLDAVEVPDYATALGIEPAELQEIILGVRPEHTTVLFDNAEDAIECTIDVNEMMGSELHLHLRSKNDDKIIVRLPTVDLSKEQRASLSYGNKMYITFPAKVMHLFDPETEKSLIDG